MRSLRFSLLAGCLFLVTAVLAQPNVGDPPTPDGPPVPLTGVEYLIAAGAAWGAKKYLDARKGRPGKSKTPEGDE